LHLDSGTSTDIIIEKDNAGSGTLRFHNDGSQVSYIQLDASEDMVHFAGSGVNQIFYAGGAERMRIDSSGTLTTPSGVDFNIMSASGMTLGSTTSITTFKTNNIERARINADGYVLIGKTNPTFSDAGIELRSGNLGARFTCSNAEPILVNRTGSNGDIIKFYALTTEIGKIGSALGDSSVSTLFIADAGNVGIRFDQASTDDIQPCSSSGADRDAAINLGASDNRFKDLHLSNAIGNGAAGLLFNDGSSDDLIPYSMTAGDTIDNSISLGIASKRFKNLYLSGGVYLGGTSSTNYLDDYEEGTWTPTITGSSGASGQSYNIQNGRFTKIGSFVHYTFDVQLSAVGTLSGTYIVIGGLPFTGVGGNLGGTATIGYHNVGGNAQPLGAYVSGSNVYLMEQGASGSDYVLVSENRIGSSSRILGSIMVHTAS
jgi:hypothetical protein